MDLVEHDVRFGEVGPGRLLHHARLFHLLVVAAEALCERVGDPFPAAVAAGRIPYAPVDVRASFVRYPRHGETVAVEGTPLSVGESSVTVGYTLRRADDDARFGTATVAHVTLDEAWRPSPIPGDARERLRDAVGAFPGVAHELEPDDADVGASPFTRRTTVRSPQIEAVGAGYFEEYFREIAMALEERLERRGRSLGERSGPTYPYVPTAAAFEFRRPVAFEDEVAVEGRLVEAADAGGDADRPRGHYRFRGEDWTTRLRGVVEYGRFDADGRRVDRGP